MDDVLEERRSGDVAADRVLLINAIHTPLGFFVLIALILEVVLLPAATLSDNVSFLAPLILLGITVLGVFLTVHINPLALYLPKDWPVPLTLAIVPDGVNIPADVDFDVDQCKLIVRSEQGRRKRTLDVNLTRGYGGWSCQISRVTFGSGDSVSLELVDRDGWRWVGSPLAPFAREAHVRREHTGGRPE
jgi:hypothetical protein